MIATGLSLVHACRYLPTFFTERRVLGVPTAQAAFLESMSMARDSQIFTVSMVPMGGRQLQVWRCPVALCTGPRRLRAERLTARSLRSKPMAQHSASFIGFQVSLTGPRRKESCYSATIRYMEQHGMDLVTVPEPCSRW